MIWIVLITVFVSIFNGLAVLMAFHCGFVWGRYRISAYEFWKRGMTYDSKEPK